MAKQDTQDKTNNYDIGDVVRAKCEFRDPDTKALVDPTTVKCFVRTSANVVSENTAVRDSAGLYHYNITVTLEGRWYYRFAGTGTYQSAAEGQFYVKQTNFPA